MHGKRKKEKIIELKNFGKTWRGTFTIVINEMITIIIKIILISTILLFVCIISHYIEETIHEKTISMYHKIFRQTVGLAPFLPTFFIITLYFCLQPKGDEKGIIS